MGWGERSACECTWYRAVKGPHCTRARAQDPQRTPDRRRSEPGSEAPSRAEPGSVKTGPQAATRLRRSDDSGWTKTLSGARPRRSRERRTMLRAVRGTAVLRVSPNVKA